MEQLSFIDMPQPRPIVNVAMVPQRSPFRYPGGKTWLVPHIREWLSSRNTVPVECIEPFAGGAIVSLTVAFERLAKHATLVELDKVRRDFTVCRYAARANVGTGDGIASSAGG